MECCFSWLWTDMIRLASNLLLKYSEWLFASPVSFLPVGFLDNLKRSSTEYCCWLLSNDSNLEQNLFRRQFLTYLTISAYKKSSWLLDRLGAKGLFKDWVVPESSESALDEEFVFVSLLRMIQVDWLSKHINTCFIHTCI